MDVSVLIAKTEIGQPDADAGADVFNVDLRGRTDGLVLTSLSHVDREQGKAEGESATSTPKQVPHADRSFPPVIIPVVPRFIPTVPLNLGQGINSLTADMIPVEASRIGL